MPKIIDHEQRREEIALRSAELFLVHGYKNIGMRQLCDQLGMSKSALYYYYKSKDELFRAATEAIVNFDSDAIAHRPSAEQATPAQRVENFLLIMQQIAPRYFQELKLVSDYIDVIGQEQIADDECMKLANQKYLAMLSHYVSKELGEMLFTLLLGLLNHQLLIGRTLESSYITKLVSTTLRQDL